ncbi:MAG: NUDIX domain-containing protein [Acidimicrobiales bacterium]
MPRRSAGLVLYRRAHGGLEVLLAHMGGPLWARRDEGAWTFPKGECEPGEDPAAAAEREYAEELGVGAPSGERIALGELRQAGGKWTQLWAVEGDFDPAELRSGTFSMPWPPRSGPMAEFPEVDRVAWMGMDEARAKVVKSLAPFLDRLKEALGATGQPL